MSELKHSKILIAYFSRGGEQYSVGNIIEGNTSIIAKSLPAKQVGICLKSKLPRIIIQRAIQS